MQRFRFFIALLFACISVTAHCVWASSSKLGVYAITGTYTCVTRQDNYPTVRFTSTNRPWGAWVRADASFPRQKAVPQGESASTFVGFDRTAHRWSIVSLDRDGSYYTRHSTSKTFDGSHWVDNFPADGGTAIINVSRDGNYTFDFTPKGQPKDVSHTQCTRVP